MPYTEQQQAIYDACAPRGQGNHKISDPTQPPSTLFVKYGTNSLFGEARTQRYLFDLAASDALAPRVPEVIDVFPGPNGSAFLVMSYVPAHSFHDWIDEANLSATERGRRLAVAIDKVAMAVSWLLDQKPPSGNVIGPIGGGNLQHDFTCKEEANLLFNDALAVQRYANEALSRLPGKYVGPWVSIAGEELVIGHSDISLRNFLFNHTTGEVWIIDCGHINVVPLSLASYAVHLSGDTFVRAVSQRLQLSRSSQLPMLERAAELIMQSGGSTFGLDETGLPKSRRRTVLSRVPVAASV